MNIDEDFIDECMSGLAELENRIRERYEAARNEYYKVCTAGWPDVDMDEISDEWLTDIVGMVEHIGYVTSIEKVEVCGQVGYRITGCDLIENARPKNDFYKGLTFEETDSICGHKILVWQRTMCCEDDYYGYLLMPMPDGRYWMIYYSDI